jgi:hypothetical protein
MCSYTPKLTDASVRLNLLMPDLTDASVRLNLLMPLYATDASVRLNLLMPLSDVSLGQLTDASVRQNLLMPLRRRGPAAAAACVCRCLRSRTTSACRLASAASSRCTYFTTNVVPNLLLTLALNHIRLSARFGCFFQVLW